jgi:hypothetical protein
LLEGDSLTFHLKRPVEIKTADAKTPDAQNYETDDMVDDEPYDENKLPSVEEVCNKMKTCIIHNNHCTWSTNTFRFD